jgi:hypothetical protein
MNMSGHQSMPYEVIALPGIGLGRAEKIQSPAGYIFALH